MLVLAAELIDDALASTSTAFSQIVRPPHKVSQTYFADVKNIASRTVIRLELGKQNANRDR
jgi:hypothetical protein